MTARQDGSQGMRDCEGVDLSIEAAVDEVIAEHGGDTRAAIRALIAAGDCLEAARDVALAQVSFGYKRGRLRTDHNTSSV
jgi:hypothetical protein